MSKIKKVCTAIPGEAMPNGGRVDMGAYGSMIEWPLEGDVNRNGIVNMLDFAIVAGGWMDILEWME